MAVRAEKGMVRVVARVARAPTGVLRAQLMSEAVIDLFFPQHSANTWMHHCFLPHSQLTFRLGASGTGAENVQS